MVITEAFTVYEHKVLYKQKEKTHKNYRSILNSTLQAWGDILLTDISEQHIMIWESYMEERGLTGTTRRGYIQSFRKIINFYRSKGFDLINLDAWELPSNDTPPRSFLASKEVEKLIEVANNPRDRAIIACLFLAGTRISEMLNLDRSDLNAPPDENGFIEVSVKGKGDKYRAVFFNLTAQQYVNAYLKTRTDRFAPIFISAQNRRISVSRVEQIVHQCTRDAGLEKCVTPHTMRHSFATDLLKNGAPLYEVSKLLGHANIATTANIYGHFDNKMRKEALAQKQSRLAFTIGRA